MKWHRAAVANGIARGSEAVGGLGGFGGLARTLRGCEVPSSLAGSLLGTSVRVPDDGGLLFEDRP